MDPYDHLDSDYEEFLRKENLMAKKVNTIEDFQRKKERGQTNEEFYEWVSSWMIVNKVDTKRVDT